MTVSQPPSRPTNQPTWEVAHLFPAQGTWTEADYLSLLGNRLVELSDGVLEVLPMPTEAHQLIVLYLYRMLHAFVASRRAGTVIAAPLRVRLWTGKFREPDVAFMTRENGARRNREFWDGADLTIEVVSDDDRRRDLEVKRSEYAAAGIREYWIVDPKDAVITVLKLDGDRYTPVGAFSAGERAGSALLPGFEVDVRETFAAAEGE